MVFSVKLTELLKTRSTYRAGTTTHHAGDGIYVLLPIAFCHLISPSSFSSTCPRSSLSLGRRRQCPHFFSRQRIQNKTNPIVISEKEQKSVNYIRRSIETLTALYPLSLFRCILSYLSDRQYPPCACRRSPAPTSNSNQHTAYKSSSLSDYSFRPHVGDAYLYAR
jgi:hypothetical protein